MDANDCKRLGAGNDLPGLVCFAYKCKDWIAKENFASIEKNKYNSVHGIDARAEREVLRPLGRGLTSVEYPRCAGCNMFPRPQIPCSLPRWGRGLVLVVFSFGKLI